MAHIVVEAATLANNRIEKLRVKMDRLPVRTIDRDTAFSWLKEGHSLVPVGGAALQLVETSEDQFVIRPDADKVDEDSVPGVPQA